MEFGEVDWESAAQIVAHERVRWASLTLDLSVPRLDQLV